MLGAEERVRLGSVDVWDGSCSLTSPSQRIIENDRKSKGTYATEGPFEVEDFFSPESPADINGGPRWSWALTFKPLTPTPVMPEAGALRAEAMQVQNRMGAVSEWKSNISKVVKLSGALCALCSPPSFRRWKSVVLHKWHYIKHSANLKSKTLNPSLPITAFLSQQR